MACNCATNEQLNEIYKKFGTKIRVSKSDSLAFRVKAFMTNTFALTTLITTAPILVFYITFNYARGNNKISLADFFGLRKETIV